MLVPSTNLLNFWNSPVNFTIHFRYVQCWYFSGAFCDSESSGNFVMEVHEYVNVYESFYISADISAHTDCIWSPWLSRYADKLSIYIWAPHNNDGDRSIDWRILQSYSSNFNIVGILSYGFRDSIEKCAQLNCKALYICCEWIYAPRTIILVQYKLWICVNEWSNIIARKFYFHKYSRKCRKYMNMLLNV